MSEPSTTAKMVAIGRGLHRLRGSVPWVFDDPYALCLVGPGWAELEARLAAVFPAAVMSEATASVAVRARYAEDRLVSGRFGQYVVLGAGLESFAWRRPDLSSSVLVYEVDEAGTQAWKRQRASLLGLLEADNQIFVPVDFETETLAGALDAAGFDWNRPTLFSWLGVTMYLTVRAIEDTLRSVGKAAPGSEVVFTYGATECCRDATGNAFVESFGRLAAAAGEPLTTFLSPGEAEQLVRNCGLEVAEHPERDELVRTYFEDRADGLRPTTAERIMTAAVPDAPGQ